MNSLFPVPDLGSQPAAGNSKRQQALLLISILLMVDKNNMRVGASAPTRMLCWFMMTEMRARSRARCRTAKRESAMTTPAEILEQHTTKGELFEKLDRGRVHCFACAHRCTISEGESGICKMRINRGGTLRVPFGYVSGTQCDPIEKKPFFHVRPGSRAFSFGMLGCNLHCGYCQNWGTLQTLQDTRAYAPPQPVTADAIVNHACDEGAGIVVSTYNEPLITAEWSAAVFKQAKAAGLMTGFVSNGYGTPEVLKYLRPYLDLFKVDLKCYNDRHYRQFGGRLQPVLDTILSLHATGIWVEVVTLLVPGFNHSHEELTKLRSTSPAFHLISHGM